MKNKLTIYHNYLIHSLFTKTPMSIYYENLVTNFSQYKKSYFNSMITLF